MIEASFNVDSFGQNIQYTGPQAIARQIHHLIAMKKGTDPLNPDKGCDINSYYYAFADSATLFTLQNAITEQISTYTPYITSSVYCRAVRNDSGKFILHAIVNIQDYDRVLIVSTNGIDSQIAAIRPETL